VVAAAALLSFTGQWRTLWPAFGASNQLVAALALLVVSMWLIQRGRGSLPTLIPALLMLVTTIGALVVQIHSSLVTDAPLRPNWVLAFINATLIGLAIFVFVEAMTMLRNHRARASATAAAD